MNSSTGETITGETYSELHLKVAERFKKEGINFNSKSIAQEILTQNKVRTKKKVVETNKLTLADAIKGATALLKHATGTSASNNEILRRSAICAACPHKTRVSNCMSCGGSKRVAGLVTAIKVQMGKQVQVPDSVNKDYCDICGCSLALLVVTKFVNLNPESQEKIAQRPAYCWMNPNSHNFTNE